MRPHFHTQIQIAPRRAHRSGVAFARYTQARTARQSRWNPYVDRFRPPHTPFAAARAAWRADLSRAAATVARNVEPHPARGLLDRSAAVANRASLRRSYRACAMAGFASVQPRDLQLLNSATHSIPEIDFHLILQVAPGFLLRCHRAAAASAKELAEPIAGAACAPAFTSGTAKVEPTEVKIHRGVFIATAARRRGSRIKLIPVKAVLIILLPPLA